MGFNTYFLGLRLLENFLTKCGGETRYITTTESQFLMISDSLVHMLQYVPCLSTRYTNLFEKCLQQ